ncbi:DEAD/DEAH box helicase family protein [bacterium]|nr:DEAD/DEAH box helicase family protein [bacterium]
MLQDQDLDQYEYVFIDEAHRFRNKNTSNYVKLSKITKNKKTILLSATPFNNKLEDLYNLINLINPLRHDIP